jgi:hypothetical protein
VSDCATRVEVLRSHAFLQGGDDKVDLDALMAMMDYANPFTVRDMPPLVAAAAASSSSSRRASGVVETGDDVGAPSSTHRGGDWIAMKPVGAASVLRLLEQDQAECGATDSPGAESVEDTAIIEGTASSSSRTDVTPPAESAVEADDDGAEVWLPVPDAAARPHSAEAAEVAGAESAGAEVQVAGEEEGQVGGGETSGLEGGRATPEVGALLEQMVEELAAEL